jgi:hypothetical protein
MSMIATTQDLHSAWELMFPESPITPKQVCTWLLMHGEATVREAFARTSIKKEQDTLTSPEKYASSVMARMSREAITAS